jgi:nucleotide-binding universal stress UspA family protein
MVSFRKILFPIDYSEPCKEVVPYVRDILSHYSAELTLLHAWGPANLGFIDLPMVDPSFLDEARAVEEKRLALFARESFPGQSVLSITELDDPAAAIHKVIQDRGADLVMLPTHGRGPLRRLLLGSVTAKVLHDLNVPVWTGTRSVLAGHNPRVPYRAVVCALNGGDEDVTVLRAAQAIAASYRAQLSLVRVVEMPRQTMDIDYTRFIQAIMDSADDQMRKLKSTLGIDAPQCVIQANVADGVSQTAIRAEADLIITGRGHAHGRVSRIWSHLYEIVRESPCPILSV